MPWNPETLRRLRARRKLTQAALADRVGCHIITIAKIETGVRLPGIELAEAIAKALRVKVDTLLK